MTRLTFDGLLGITRTVQQMHNAVAGRSMPLSAPPHDASTLGGISQSVYAGLQSALAGLGTVVDKSLALLANGTAESPDRATGDLTLQAVLNGICGDHLAATGNSLAIQMQFASLEYELSMAPGQLELAFPQASPHIAIYAHGLCLSRSSWARNNSRPIGDRLQQAAGLTPVYLQYNSGRHISTNGRQFADLLEQLVANWPVPVDTISLVGHSMGGLVIRSACWYAEQAGHSWCKQLKRILCLGTPHHGAPLEKAGHLLGRAMRASPYLAPLDFGRYRSAGIKDLRFGNLLDEDWLDRDPDMPAADHRRPVPLQNGVQHYFIAATVGQHAADLRGRALGDLLVRSGSAVGAHAEQSRNLDVDPDNCCILHRRNHFDLLTDAAVHDQVLRWFGGETA